jgi:acetyl esterase
VEAGYAALEWLYKRAHPLAGKAPPSTWPARKPAATWRRRGDGGARPRHPPLAGQVLVAPMLDPCAATPSLRETLGDDRLQVDRRAGSQYLRGPMDAEHPYAVPARAQRLAGLPPALVLAGQDDPMRDEALAYARAAARRRHRRDHRVLGPATGWPDRVAGGHASDRCPCERRAPLCLRAFFSAPTPPPG